MEILKSGIEVDAKGKNKVRLFLIFVLFPVLLLNATDKISIVHNTLHDIEACEGKLKLKFVRAWGGDDEEDRHKFFKSPMDIVVDDNDLVYILDKFKHRVKVFRRNGEYVRKIGGRGKGPGDLFSPERLAIAPGGDLVVLDDIGHRVQRFSPKGKSKSIIQLREYGGYWFGVTSENEYVIYNSIETFSSRKLLSVFDSAGNKIREIGEYHDNAPDFLQSEKLTFGIDQNDIIYAANRHSPVIRKYSTEGKLLGVITYETMIKSPFQVAVNENGDEIKITGEVKYGGGARERRTATGVVVESGEDRVRLPKQLSGFTVDSNGRMFMITISRFLTEDEKSITGISGGATSAKVHIFKKAKKEPKDHMRLIVFNSSGKVTAATLLSDTGRFSVQGNRIFFIDTFFNKEIKEFEMTFDF